jgi:uncharacterized protein DUF3800
MPLCHEDKFLAYLDESKSGSGEMVCSAGYLFEAPLARQFREEWQSFLDSKEMRFFHATDDIRKSDAEEIFSTLATLTKRTAYQGFVNFVDPAALKSVDKSIRGYIGSSFSIATLGCMSIMANKAKEQGRSVVYFIENGNPFDGELKNFLTQIRSDPRHAEIYAMAAADTVDKRDVIQLQAADLFAWSFGRSSYRGRWEEKLKDLVRDKSLQHVMTTYNPTMLAMINSFHGLKSNRTKLDY